MSLHDDYSALRAAISLATDIDQVSRATANMRTKGARERMAYMFTDIDDYARCVSTYALQLFTVDRTGPKAVKWALVNTIAFALSREAMYASRHANVQKTKAGVLLLVDEYKKELLAWDKLLSNVFEA